MNHDKLEHFVHRHREEFDGEAPPQGLWDRIEKNLSEGEEDGGDPLEEFIAKHREAFDTATPPPRLAERLFKGGAPERRRTGRRRLLIYALGVAASLLLLFTVYRFGSASGYEAGREEQRIAQELEKMDPELVEAERFYRERIDREYAKVRQVNDDPQLRQDLADIDEATSELRSELLQVPASQRHVLVNQLISTYRTKLDILLRIQQHFPNPNNPGAPAPAGNTSFNES